MISLTDLFGQEADILRHEDFQLLLAANVVTVLGTALISPILDTLTGPFGVSTARIGLMVTAYAAPAVVLIPIMGALVDRIGRKPAILAGLLLFGTAGTAIGFVTDFEVVLALRLVQGVGFSGTVPIIITSVGDLYSGNREAAGQGFRFAVAGVSQAFFPLLAGTLVVLAWWYPFFLYALAIPTAVVLYLRFEEPTDVERDADPDPTASNGGAGSSADSAGAPAPDRPRLRYVRRLVRLMARPRVAAILLARGTLVVPFIGFLTYNSVVVVRLQDGTPQLAGLTVATFSLVYAAAATQAGRVTATFGSRTGPLIAANVCLVVGLAVFSLTPSRIVLFAGILSLGTGVGILFSLYRSLITGFAPQTLRGGLVSISESLGRVAATVTPIAMGGTIVFLEPRVGADVALQWTVFGTGLVGAATGILCTLVSTRSSPVPGSGDV